MGAVHPVEEEDLDVEATTVEATGEAMSPVGDIIEVDTEGDQEATHLTELRIYQGHGVSLEKSLIVAFQKSKRAGW